MFLIFPHLLVTNLDFFVFLVRNTFVNIVFSFSLNFLLTFLIFLPLYLLPPPPPFYSCWHKVPPAPTKLSHPTASKIHGERKQSRAVYIPASPGLGRWRGYVPALINRELLVTV